MHQSFELHPHPHPHPHLHPGHGRDIHSVWVWKPMKILVTGAKILSEVPAPWYSVVQTKVPCVEPAVTAFLKSCHQILKSISKRRNVNASYINNLCQMFKLLSGMKSDHCDWQIKSEPPSQPWRSLPDFQMARSRLLPPSPGWLWAVWKSVYKEVKVSVHSAPQGNTSWWIRGDYPRFTLAIPGWDCITKLSV